MSSSSAPLNDRCTTCPTLYPPIACLVSLAKLRCARHAYVTHLGCPPHILITPSFTNPHFISFPPGARHTQLWGTLARPTNLFHCSAYPLFDGCALCTPHTILQLNALLGYFNSLENLVCPSFDGCALRMPHTTHHIDAQLSHTFTDSSYAPIHPMASAGRLTYPFTLPDFLHFFYLSCEYIHTPNHITLTLLARTSK